MKNLFAVCVFLFAAFGASAQAVRIDPLPVLSIAATSGAGSYPVVIAVPGATVTLCGYPADASPCTNYATTYTDATGATACPASAQIVLAGTSNCTNTTGTQGGFGFWVVPGNYSYTEVLPNGQQFGPYPVSAGGGTGTVGSGTVTSVSIGSMIPWLSATFGANPTTAPVLALTAATGQISHEVIGTCGTSTVFGPCALTASDIPILNQNTTGYSTGFTGSLTGDVVSSGMVTALPTVNSSPGPCGDAAHVCQVTTDAKGRVISQTVVAITGGGGGGGSVSTVSISGGTPISPTSGNVDLPLPQQAAQGYGTRTVITGTGDSAVNTVNAEETAIDKVTTTGTYAIPNTDQGGSVWYSASGSATMTLPQAGIGSAWTTGRRVMIWMLPGCGAITLNATTSTVNGSSASLPANAGTLAVVHVVLTDGTNYEVN